MLRVFVVVEFQQTPEDNLRSARAAREKRTSKSQENGIHAGHVRDAGALP